MTQTTLPGKGIPITLDGEDRVLRLDLTASLDFEEQTGKNALKIMADIAGACVSGARDLNVTWTGESAAPAEYGRLIPAVVEAAGLSLSDVAILFWACLGGKESDLTLSIAVEVTKLTAEELRRDTDLIPNGVIRQAIREAGRLATHENIVVVGRALAEAVQAAMPEAKPGESSAGADPTNLPTG